jgi:hypothetical protein
MLYIATLIHTSSGTVTSTAGIETPNDATDTELINRIKRGVGTAFSVSDYPHTVNRTPIGIEITLTDCRYHIYARRVM